ncbi:hypothetical protein Tco_1110776 [Tanacetum coccineum]|uniref:Uncharacterized protein n=1 Tax=Tanacetum coccineum TaxID=301880 RepID=A0ABQ5ILV2_9ASTR
MNGGAVDWKSSKQSTTLMSSMEAEYTAAAEAVMESIWIHKFISGLGVVPSIDKPMDMYCDNIGSITIADELVFKRVPKIFEENITLFAKLFKKTMAKKDALPFTLKVVYVLTTPMPELLEEDTVEAIRQCRVCKGVMVDSRLVMEQFNELFRIVGQYIQHGLKKDESISISSAIDKLPPSWKDFKHSLKHGKDNLSLVQLGYNQKRILFDLRRLCYRVVYSLELNFWVVRIIVQRKTLENQYNLLLESGAYNPPGYVQPQYDQYYQQYLPPPQYQQQQQDDDDLMQLCSGLILVPQLMFVKIVSGLRHMNQWKTDLSFTWVMIISVHGKGSVVLEFSSGKSITLFNVLYVPKLYESQMDDHSNDVPSETPKPRKGKEQENIKEDPRTYNEAMQSQDVAFWKEAINDEIGSIIENNT